MHTNPRPYDIIITPEQINGLHDYVVSKDYTIGEVLTLLFEYMRHVTESAGVEASLEELAREHEARTIVLNDPPKGIS